MNSNREMDTFVGLRCNDGDISINFPLGYHISEDDNELRKDIILLLTTLSANTERKESEILKRGNVFDEVDFHCSHICILLRTFLYEVIIRSRKFYIKLPNWGKSIGTGQ